MGRILGGILAMSMLVGCVHGPGAGGSVGNVSAASASAVIDQAGIETAILDVMTAQSEAWNGGDIPAFMEHYWKDDQLRFGSGGNITRGWQATLERYLRTYSTRAQMGQLDFSDLEVHPLARDAGVVHGRWKLTRNGDTPSGLFTLVFRDFGAGWVIVSDTTTAAR